MFNQKNKVNLVTFDYILAELARLSVGSFITDDPSDTVWYLNSDESLMIMAHPAYGLVFYNDEMHIVGMFTSKQEDSILNMLDDWSIYGDSKVWREIGIDQVDFHFQS